MDGLGQQGKLLRGVDFVLDQELELFLVSVKLDDIVHHVAAPPRRGRGLFQLAQQIEIVITQRPEARQFLGLASHLILPSGGPYWLIGL